MAVDPVCVPIELHRPKAWGSTVIPECWTTGGNVSAWRWGHGDGEVKSDDLNRLVISTSSPPERGDNRVGITADMGDPTCGRFVSMRPAYRATGNPKYADTFVQQLNSWLDQIPLRIIAS